MLVSALQPIGWLKKQGAVLLSNRTSLSRLSHLVGALEARSEEITALLALDWFLGVRLSRMSRDGALRSVLQSHS
jgi:hypothetical protein